MNWVDSLVLLIVVLSAIVAFARGFVSEALGIAAWVGAYFVAVATAPFLIPSMRDWLGNTGDIADPAAYGVVFLVALLAFSVVTGVIGRVVRTSLLGGIDRTLGMIFGLVRGVVIVAAIYVAGTYVVPTDKWPDAVAEARSLPHIYAIANWMALKIPEGFRPHVPRPPEPRPTKAADLLQAAPHGKATARP
jgi:membrane protein required for colicin V production